MQSRHENAFSGHNYLSEIRREPRIALSLASREITEMELFSAPITTLEVIPLENSWRRDYYYDASAVMTGEKKIDL